MGWFVLGYTIIGMNLKKEYKRKVLGNQTEHSFNKPKT